MKSKSLFAVLAVFVLLVGLSGIVHPAAANTTPPAPGENLSASISAQATWKVVYDWSLAKSVSPATWDLFAGDSGASRYTVTATRTLLSENTKLYVYLCIYNGAAVATEGLAVTFTVTQDSTDAVVATLTPNFSAVSIDAGGTFCGSWDIYFNPALVASGNRFTVTADITSNNVPGDSVSASADLQEGPHVINDTLVVSDSNGHGSPWTFYDSGTQTYEETFTCDEDAGRHDNTVSATVYLSGIPKPRSAGASVQVNCYGLNVSKTAGTTFERKYTWGIDKSSGISSLTLSPGQTVTVPYSVTVNVTGQVDGQFFVGGGIRVSNPAPMAAVIDGVSDVVSGGIAAGVTCPVSFPYTLGAGETLNCSYGAALPDASDRLNTATAVQQNYAYAPDGSTVPAGTSSYSGTAAVSFGSAGMSEVDECVAVADSLYGDLGVVCKSDSPKTFNYTLTVGEFGTCGQYSIQNTAAFTTNDSGATGSDRWVIDVSVPCVSGCSLTPGYWKTHSSYGPAPYDETWAQIGENSPFFLSGKSWYAVLWTVPQGNPYYILAHAYIAARLNALNGADVSAISAQLDWATGFFTTTGPTATLSKSLRTQVLSVASILDNYNNGLIGPGHCSE